METATLLAPPVILEVDRPYEDDPVRTLVVRDADGAALGSITFYDSAEVGTGGPRYLLIDMVEVNRLGRRRGLASAMMAELERLHPGVPINHHAVTIEGMAWNAAYYGHPLPGEHTVIGLDDSDVHLYADYKGCVKAGIMYRAGWTRDAQRIAAPSGALPIDLC